jgi:RNA polymerase sigma factor (TIGR02999 family)
MTESTAGHEVTAILQEWQQGDVAALDRLVPLVYEELRKVARAHLRGERAGHTLQTTALVHEAYLRLVDLDRLNLKSRAHLLAMAARLMRQVLVDHARKKRAARRGGDATMMSLDDVAVAAPAQGADVLAVDEALTELTSFDARLCRVVELKFFAGMSIDETAEALGVSPVTVERDWAMAKAWLFQRLTSPPV